MKLLFKSVEIENFLSIGKATLALDSSGFISIIGKNLNIDDNSLSNGSGKSSIWEAVVWCLTGSTMRGTTSVENAYSTGGTKVELVFIVDSNVYKVGRYKNHIEYKTNLKIFKNGEDISGKGIRDSEGILKNILPDINIQLIGSVIVLGQGLPQKFTGNTPSGRKEVLESLSKSDFMIEDLRRRVSSRKDMINSYIRDFSDKKISNEGAQHQLQKQKELLEKKIADLESQKEHFFNIPVLEENKKDIEEDILNKEAKIKEFSEDKENKLKQINTLLEATHKEESELNRVYEDKLIVLRDKHTKAIAECTSLSNEIKKLESITDICPTCGQKIIGVEKPNTSEQKRKLFELREEEKRVSAAIDSTVAKKDCEISKIRSTLKTKTVSLKEEVRKIDETLTDINRSQIANNKRLQEVVDELNKLLSAKDTYEALSSQYLSELKTVDESLHDISEEILYNISDIDNLKEHLSVISKFETVLKRDFRGVLLTNVLNYLNNKVKEFSEIVYKANAIKFVLDGNNLDIKYFDRDYENLSGGERQKVDILVQLAIREMLVEFLNFSCNCMVFDEIFDNLDSDGCRSIIELLSQKLNDVSSVYFISHHTDIDIPIDKTIEVIKDKSGVSIVHVV